MMTSVRRGTSAAPAGGGDSSSSPPAASVAIVFVNGLGRPMAAWDAARARLPAATAAYTTVAYDRFGQGATPPLPADVPDALRDAAAAARDLRELLGALAARGVLAGTGVSSAGAGAADTDDAGVGAGAGDVEERAEEDQARPGEEEEIKIILVAHSIGVAIARLFMVDNGGGGHRDGDGKSTRRGPPFRVAAALFLDPSPVNTDWVSLYPAPREGEPADLTETRDATRRIYHPDAPNAERFNRRTLAALLPRADAPALPGDPRVTVVAHDPPVAFGEASEKAGIHPKYALRYVEPYWQEYNRGLLESVPPEKRRGPLMAEGADHFIQVCRPDMVADEIEHLVKIVTSHS